MNDRIADTRQCPYCRAWVTMPLRRQREAFEAHKLACRAAVPGAVIVPSPSPAFNPDCGLCGADLAADPFHACEESDYPPLYINDHMPPVCDCGRGPILQGNGTPDCCVDCYGEHVYAEAAALNTESEQRVLRANDGYTYPQPSTVKRADLFGNVIDTFRTEAEMNGHRATQGRMI